MNAGGDPVVASRRTDTVLVFRPSMEVEVLACGSTSEMFTDPVLSTK